MKRRRTRRTQKAALPPNPLQQVLGDLVGEVQQHLLSSLLPKQITPMFQPVPQQQPEIKDAEVIAIRNNP